MSATWNVTDLSRAAPAYKQLAVLLCDDLRYVKALMECVKAEDVDNVAKALVHVSGVMGRSLPMIRVMTRGEFERNSSVTTIFRLQSLASRTIGHYVRKAGHVYLTIVLGDYLQRAIDTDLATPFEVDPNKLKLRPGDVEDDVLHANRAKLMQVAQTIFDRITSPTMVEIMPRGMRAACHFIGSVCDEYTNKFTPDDKAKLIGGFIMLRFFNPALLTPESHGLLAPGIAPSPVQRRNLTLVTKLLQNLSNNVQFGQKEKFMSHLNPFLKANAKRMRAFLDQLPRDPRGKEWEEIDHLTPLTEPATLRDFPLRDFVILHRVVVKHAATLGELVSKMERMAGVTNGDVTLSDVVTALGDEPRFSEKRVVDTGADRLGKALSVSLDSRIGCKAIRADADQVPDFLHKAFLYAGPPAADGNAVVFLIGRRCLYEWLRFSKPLTEFIKTQYDEAMKKGKGKLDLVIDLSWTSVPNDHAHSFMQDLTKFLQGLPGEWVQRLDHIYVVNPNRLFFLACHMFAKLHAPVDASKIVEMYSWKELRGVVDETHLPEESKFFFPECYLMEVVKKRSPLSNRIQYRLVKLTTQSLLVIDPATYVVKSEYWLSDLAAVSHTDHVLQLTFESDGWHPGAFCEPSKPIAQFSLRARSGEEVEQFVNSLLQTRIELPLHRNQRRDFVVSKKNSKGHSQTRTMKVLGDCLMNVKGNSIRSFIPYLGIGDVVLQERLVTLVFAGMVDKKERQGRRELKLKDESVAKQFHAMVRERVDNERHAVAHYLAHLSEQFSRVTFVDIVTAFRYARVWIRRVRVRIPHFARPNVPAAPPPGPAPLLPAPPALQARAASGSSNGGSGVGGGVSGGGGGGGGSVGQDKQRLLNFQVVAGDDDSSDESAEEEERTPKASGEWVPYKDASGKTYYHNPVTKQSSWTLPS